MSVCARRTAAQQAGRESSLAAVLLEDCLERFIRDATAITNTTHGVGEGRAILRPKTTLPHRPPGPLAADRIVVGGTRGHLPVPGGTRRLSFPPVPVKVTCAKTSSNRAAVFRLASLARRGASLGCLHGSSAWSPGRLARGARLAAAASALYSPAP
eukprot:scaffold30799_cov56-Phaeocystis_antarctica.AAC.1